MNGIYTLKRVYPVERVYLLIVFIVFSTNGFSQKLDGFFRYYKLSNSMRLAFDDYLATSTTDTCNSLFIMDIGNDTTKAFFIDGYDLIILTNPPYYYSYYKQ